MKKLQSIVSILLLCYIILCLCSSCSSPTAQGNSLLHDNAVDTIDSQEIAEFVMKLKERNEFLDREILNIDKLVFTQWHPMGSSIMIIPLNDKGEWLLDEYVDLAFDGSPNYDSYGKDGENAVFVEVFMADINKKQQYGVTLTNFIQKDLVVSLEFSDNSTIVFDRYYKELEENLEVFRKELNK